MATVDPDAGLSARARMAEMLEAGDPYEYEPAKLLPLQLAAAQEMFAEMRPKIPVLDRRAEESGVERIETIADIVPLLLSHTSYKAYPQSFVQKRQWDKLATWLSVVSTESFEDVDVKDAVDIDDFLNRMWAAGYKITTSSGTGGKVSLLPKSQRDLDCYHDYLRRFSGQWPDNCIASDQSYHFFQFGPTRGANTAAFSAAFRMEDFGRPDSRHVLIDEPLLIGKVAKMAEMREKMKAGKATPEEIQEMEADAARQAAKSAARFDEMVDRIGELRREPVYIMAMAAQMFEVVERLRSRGICGGDFHPRSVIAYGGGTKHFKLPDDWEAQIAQFFGNVIYARGYGMTEMNWLSAHCPADHYHIAPTIIPLVLEESGDKLVEPHEGIVTGRFGFLDLMTDIRWGGTISGDKVTIDLDGSCACGHQGPNVRSVARYADLQGEDKIECAGTIDAYIRGVMVD